MNGYTVEQAGKLLAHVMNHYTAAMVEEGLDEETIESIWTRVEGKILSDMMEIEVTGYNPALDR